jgi:O-antigen/teichoic acid export membrane protein
MNLAIHGARAWTAAQALFLRRRGRRHTLLRENLSTLSMKASASRPRVLRPMLARLNSDKVRAWSRRIGSFVVGQGAIQALNLVSGFLIIRWLSVEAFAQYSVAFAFQNTVGMLVDLGVSGSIVAMVGGRGNEPAVIGTYIRAAKHYRTISFAVVIPASAGFFVWMSLRQHWGWAMQLGLFSSVVFSLFFQGWASYYSAPLLIHHRLRELYASKLGGGGLRLAASGLFYAASSLSAVATAWINSLSLAWSAISYKRHSRDLVLEPPRADPAANREMARYLAPVVPGIIFYALQGQLTVFLITFFGKSHNIAEVAALGRLAQPLTLIAAFNGVIIEPYIARVPHVLLPKRYPLIVAGGVGLTVLLALGSYLFPTAALWIIGARYSSLHTAFTWSICAWGLNYLGLLLWTMHSARRWVYWWHTFFCIGTLTVVQVFGVWRLDLSTTVGIFEFSFLTGLAELFVHAVGGIYGYWEEGRRERLAQSADSPDQSEQPRELIVP